MYVNLFHKNVLAFKYYTKNWKKLQYILAY